MNLSAIRGEIYELTGRNGAGKTTASFNRNCLIMCGYAQIGHQISFKKGGKRYDDKRS